MIDWGFFWRLAVSVVFSGVFILLINMAMLKKANRREPWEEELHSHIRLAEFRHPDFCGMKAIYGELSDLEKAISSGSADVIRRECMHLAVVAIRFHNNLDSL